MSSGHPSDEFVSPEDVEKRLNALACFWAADMDDYHQVWLTSWGFRFIVPMIGRHRLCPLETLLEIEAEVRSMRPPMH